MEEAKNLSVNTVLQAVVLRMLWGRKPREPKRVNKIFSYNIQFVPGNVLSQTLNSLFTDKPIIPEKIFLFLCVCQMYIK